MAGGLLVGLLVALLLAVPRPVEARHYVHHRVLHHVVHRVGYVPEAESIIIDADTGQVLSQSNADALTYPASLTKMMTLFLTFQALNSGQLHLDQQLVTSLHASERMPTKLGLRPGELVPVRDLILGIVTRSANDAATVLAEGQAGGSEAAFCARMNAEARQLGMTHTFFHNASGVPDPLQRTTARDMARLALALYRDFPREYRYFSTREFDFNGQIITGHNHLLDWYRGADGIKTGFVNASGFNLAASAVRNGHRLIGVVMGGRTARSRDLEMASLLDQGFAEINGPDTLIARRGPAAPVVQAAASRPGLVARTRDAIRRLSPVARAEAAPLRVREASTLRVHDVHPAANSGGRWGIQVGAFRGEAAAKRVARAAAQTKVARGKPMQIVQPSRADHERLYRARLLGFSPKAAENACVVLHRRKIACAVMPPSALHLANR